MHGAGFFDEYFADIIPTKIRPPFAQGFQRLFQLAFAVLERLGTSVSGFRGSSIRAVCCGRRGSRPRGASCLGHLGRPANGHMPKICPACAQRIKARGRFEPAFRTVVAFTLQRKLNHPPAGILSFVKLSLKMGVRSWAPSSGIRLRPRGSNIADSSAPASGLRTPVWQPFLRDIHLRRRWPGSVFLSSQTF